MSRGLDGVPLRDQLTRVYKHDERQTGAGDECVLVSVFLSLCSSLVTTQAQGQLNPLPLPLDCHSLR